MLWRLRYPIIDSQNRGAPGCTRVIFAKANISIGNSGVVEIHTEGLIPHAHTYAQRVARLSQALGYHLKAGPYHLQS